MNAINKLRLLLFSVMTMMGMSVSSYSLQLTEDHQEDNVYLAVDRTNLRYNPAGGSMTVNVTSNIDWDVEVVGGGDWLSVSPLEGKGDGSFTVSTKENANPCPREATITVSGSGLTQTIKVRQEGNGYLTVDRTNLRYNPAGGSMTVNVTSNIDWDVEVVGGGDWLSVSPLSGKGDGSFTVSTKENANPCPREAIIIINGSCLSQTIEVYQEGTANLTVDRTNLRYNPSGGSMTVNVTSNIDWDVEVVGGGDWLSVSPFKGNGDVSLTVTATENSNPCPRTATITVSGGGLTQTIEVYQEGVAYLPVDRTNLRYSPAGGRMTVNVTSNIDWDVEVVGGGDWLSVSPLKGNGDVSLTVTATENANLSPREAIIIINGSCLSQTIEIYQEGTANLTVDRTNLHYNPSGGSMTVNVTSNIDWDVEVVGGGDWLSVSPLEGKGNGSLTVTVAEYSSPTLEPREATIIVSGSGLTQTIEVFGGGPCGYLTIMDRTNLRYSPAGGIMTVNVTSNIDWDVEVVGGGDWLSVSPLKGNGDVSLTVTATENANLSPREATITVSGSNLTQTIKVYQEGTANLTVDRTNLRYNPSGGSMTVNVTSNIDWDVEVAGGGDWLTVTPLKGSKNGSLTITAKDNSNPSPREATITVSGSNLTQTIEVYQDGNGNLTVDRTNLRYNPSGGSMTVNVTSNIDWDVEVAGGGDWLTVTPLKGSKNGSLTITAKDNSNPSPREATITVSGSNLTQTIEVYQDGNGNLTVDRTNLRYNPSGGSMTVNVTSNIDWDVEVAGGGGWLTVTPLKGSKNGSLTITATDNSNPSPREATITVSGSNLTQTIEVYQDGNGNLTVDRTNLRYNPSGGSMTVNVTSNIDWDVEVAGGGGWLSVSPLKGNGDVSLTVTATENANLSPREAIIIINGSCLSQTIEIYQEGTANLTVDRTNLRYNPAGGSMTVNVASNIEWSIEVDYVEGNTDWLTVFPQNGYGNEKITITVSPNTDNEPRCAILTVSGCGLSQQIVVSANNDASINGVTNGECINMYNILGQKVDSSCFDSLPVGIYVINGTKVLKSNK